MWISLVFIYIFADLLRFLEVKATATTQKRWNYIIEHASTFEIVYIYYNDAFSESVSSGLL